MYNSNLSKFIIVLLGLNASLIHGMDDEVQQNKELINSQEIKHVAKLKEKIHAKVVESFSANNVLPASDLADIVSDYAVISQEKLHELNEQLLKAVNEGDIKAIKEALENQADINSIDHDGNSVLGLAFKIAIFDINNLYESIINYLITKGADINNKCSGKTLLIELVNSHKNHRGLYTRNKNILLIKLLLDFGADVNIADRGGKTALDHVHDEKVKKLILAKNSVDRNIVFEQEFVNLKAALKKCEIELQEMSESNNRKSSCNVM